MRNYKGVFLFLLKRSQEAHSGSTQRLRSFEQEQKGTLEFAMLLNSRFLVFLFGSGYIPTDRHIGHIQASRRHAGVFHALIDQHQ